MFKMDGFLQKILGLPQGSPNLKDALGTIGERMRRDWEEKNTGGYILEKPFKTKYGMADSSDSLMQNYLRAVQERQEDIYNKAVMDAMPPSNQSPLYGKELGVGFGEPSNAQVKGLSSQYEQEPQMPKAQGSGIPQSIYDYATGYKYSPAGEYGKSRFDDKTLGILVESINEAYPDLDENSKNKLLANIVAVAQAESGMGGAYANPEAGNYKNTNYWNWFAGGDRNFDPENFEEMSDIIAKGIGNYTVDTGGRFTRDNASTYTGNDNLSFWYDQIYNPAMRAMGY